MQKPIEIRNELYWVGSEDPDLRTFDDLFPTEHGTTYNSYLLKGSLKTVIIDTVKAKCTDEFMDKVRSLVDPATIDYVVINHTEPDHSGALAFLLEHAPKAVVYCTTAAKTFLHSQMHKPFNCQVVKDGDTIDLGGRTLRFILAPFLHWPDTMFTRLEEEHILFSCDAFGAHYCSPGKLFNDETEDITSARQFYFDTIFRPFKDKVLSAVEKIRHDVIDMICPSHGPIIRRDPWRAIQQFENWSKPPAQSKKIYVLYLSPHGNTELMAKSVAQGASIDGVEVFCYHTNHLNTSELRNLMEDAGAFIFGVPTIARDIPPPIWELFAYLTTVKLKTNIAGVFGSYGWSGEACKMAEDRLKGIGFRFPATAVRACFKPTAEILEQCEEMGKSIATEVLNRG